MEIIVNDYILRVDKGRFRWRSSFGSPRFNLEFSIMPNSDDVDYLFWVFREGIPASVRILSDNAVFNGIAKIFPNDNIYIDEELTFDFHFIDADPLDCDQLKHLLKEDGAEKQWK